MLCWWCLRLDCLSLARPRTWGSEWVWAHLVVHFCVSVLLACNHASVCILLPICVGMMYAMVMMVGTRHQPRPAAAVCSRVWMVYVCLYRGCFQPCMVGICVLIGLYLLLMPPRRGMPGLFCVLLLAGHGGGSSSCARSVCLRQRETSETGAGGARFRLSSNVMRWHHAAALCKGKGLWGE